MRALLTRIVALSVLFVFPLLGGCGGEKAETGEAVAPDVRTNLLGAADASAEGASKEAEKAP